MGDSGHGQELIPVNIMVAITCAAMSQTRMLPHISGCTRHGIHMIQLRCEDIPTCTKVDQPWAAYRNFCLRHVLPPTFKYSAL